jgi:hypothetical protein
MPLIKQTWPQLNENGLLDDTVAMLKTQMTPAPTPTSFTVVPNVGA